MNNISKFVLALSTAPLTLVGSLAMLPGVEPVGLRTWIVVGAFTVAGATGAWLQERWHRKLIANRVVIDIKPNQLIVDGVPIDCTFSSLTRFFKSREALAAVVKVATNEAMFRKGEFAALSKSAHIRIWPETLLVSDFELEALTDAITAQFISPVFELMGQPMAPQEKLNLSSGPAANR